MQRLGGGSPALVRMGRSFGLSAFDLAVLVVAWAPEVDLRYERVYAFLNDDVTRRRPTVDLALNLLCSTAEEKLVRRRHFGARAPLVRSGLVELTGDPARPGAPLLSLDLVLPGPVAGFLLGAPGPDAGLAPALLPPPPPGRVSALSPLRRRELERMVRRSLEERRGLRLSFEGPEGSGRLATARGLARYVGTRLLALDVGGVAGQEALEPLVRRALLEVRLRRWALYVAGLDAATTRWGESAAARVVAAVARHPGVVVLEGPPRGAVAAGELRDGVTVAFPVASYRRRRVAWRRALAAARLEAHRTSVETLAGRFELNPAQVAGAVASVRAELGEGVAAGSGGAIVARLFRAAHAQAVRDLGEHALRIEPVFGWEDLVLPVDGKSQLLEICRRVEHRRRVMEEWGASFGRSLAVVRVHADAAAAWAARSVRARAFAFGKQIWFGVGEYRPGEPGGLYLLAHEVAHALEQRPATSFDSVRVGSADDPAEARADRAASAAVRREAAPAPGRSGAEIRRYAIDRVRRVEEDGEPVVEVDLDSGARYRVRRVCSVVRDERTAPGGFRPPRVTAGADRENVFVQVSWCEGTRGRVRAGADAPAQLESAIRRLVEGALSGRSPDEMLRETTLSPFVDFAIAESGGISVEGNVQVTVGGGGVRSGQASVLFRHGPVDVGVTGSAGGEGGLQVGLTLTFTPGRTSERFECPRTRRRVERLRRECTFECTHEPIERPPPRRPRTRTDREVATIYFQYTSSAPNDDLSGRELDRLRGLLREGYRVAAIHGYASPEGPLDRPRGRFQGNRPLSAERAERARSEVEALCRDAGVEGACVAGEGAVVAGCGERFGGGPECERPQEGEARSERRGREVARVAVRDFLADPSEMARLTPEDRARLSRAGTDDARALVIYPYLRRASLSLVRTVELPPPPVDPGSSRLPADYLHCPADVLERARPLLERRTARGPRR